MLHTCGNSGRLRSTWGRDWRFRCRQHVLSAVGLHVFRKRHNISVYILCKSVEHIFSCSPCFANLPLGNDLFAHCSLCAHIYRWISVSVDITFRDSGCWSFWSEGSAQRKLFTQIYRSWLNGFKLSKVRKILVKYMDLEAAFLRQSENTYDFRGCFWSQSRYLATIQIHIFSSPSKHGLPMSFPKTPTPSWKSL